eukprot:2459637-Amphidinium_carterae.1
MDESYSIHVRIGMPRHGMLRVCGATPRKPRMGGRLGQLSDSASATEGVLFFFEAFREDIPPSGSSCSARIAWSQSRDGCTDHNDTEVQPVTHPQTLTAMVSKQPMRHSKEPSQAARLAATALQAPAVG